MMVATATLATAEPDSLSPELETQPSSANSSSSNSGALANKPSPRRPTSLVIASNRSRALSAAVINSTQTTSHNTANNQTTSSATTNINPQHCSSNPVSDALVSKSLLINGSRSNKNTTITTNNITNSSQNITRNSQNRSSLSAFVSSSNRSGHHSVLSSKNNNNNKDSSSSSSMSVSTDSELTCFTSLLAARTSNGSSGGGGQNAAGGSSTSGSGGGHADESLEYASVTYRYLKQMDAANKNDAKKHANGKVPSYARSMMCLNETKASAPPDESIVSVPCPQPTSACPTPAAIRTSLRRRHSDLNLSSIANFLRTRFSRHDDTIEPKLGESSSSGEDAIDDMLKRPLLRRSSSKKQQENGHTNNKNCENTTGNNGNMTNNSTGHQQHVHKASPAHHNLLINGVAGNGSGKPSCPHPNCSNNVAGNGSAWRRPCFRCKNHLIEAILESDATEV